MQTPDIWVEERYGKPAERPGDSTFTLNSRPIYGGFNGTETTREQHNWVANPTILTGDINGNDNYATVPRRQHPDNAFHVVTAPTTAHLDGFISAAAAPWHGLLQLPSYGGGLFGATVHGRRGQEHRLRVEQRLWLRSGRGHHSRRRHDGTRRSSAPHRRRGSGCGDSGDPRNDRFTNVLIADNGIINRLKRC